jgi:hypothetical protein
VEDYAARLSGFEVLYAIPAKFCSQNPTSWLYSMTKSNLGNFHCVSRKKRGHTLYFFVTIPNLDYLENKPTYINEMVHVSIQLFILKHMQ